jgi:leucyl/phenylalanyl-tRNA--protein transferase
VLEGYRQGAFLMAVAEDAGAPPALGWYEADPRGVIRLDPPGDHIPRRLARTVASGRFVVTADRGFGRVIRACADLRREGGWINPEIITVFETLHDAGYAHSVEAWLPLDAGAAPRGTPGPLGARPDAILRDPTHHRVLVGGLYGLCVGGVFCAESMFSRPDLGGRDASKVCLARTIAHLRARGFALLDTQMHSEHLAQFGCESIRRAEYQALLAGVRDRGCDWGAFHSGD